MRTQVELTKPDVYVCPHTLEDGFPLDSDDLWAHTHCDCPKVRLEGVRKVYWIEARQGDLRIGDRLTIKEESGVWTVTQVCVTLPNNKVTVPHRLGTWQTLKRSIYGSNHSLSAIKLFSAVEKKGLKPPTK